MYGVHQMDAAIIQYMTLCVRLQICMQTPVGQSGAAIYEGLLDLSSRWPCCGNRTEQVQAAAMPIRPDVLLAVLREALQRHAEFEPSPLDDAAWVRNFRYFQCNLDWVNSQITGFAPFFRLAGDLEEGLRMEAQSGAGPAHHKPTLKVLRAPMTRSRSGLVSLLMLAECAAGNELTMMHPVGASNDVNTVFGKDWRSRWLAQASDYH